MTVFAIIATAYNEKLEGAVKDAFPDRWYKITDGQYLVSVDRGTPGRVMERLGIKDASFGRFMILRVGSYTGWHVKDLWDWIEAQNAPPSAPESEPGPDGPSGSGDE